MINIHNRIEVYERGLEKMKRELRGYRYPSKSYLNCEKRIKNLENALKKLYAEAIIQKANLQIRIFNQEEYNELL